MQEVKEVTFCANVRRMLLCAFYAVSIIGALLVYGLYQEGIMSQAYGDNEYFTVSVFLVLFNRVFGSVFAFIMIFLVRESFRCSASLWMYVLIAVSTVLASICQYEALKYVSFTVQILGKSFKMMPVMMWSMLILRRKYRALDWFVAAGVTTGVIWFISSGSITPPRPQGSSLYGILLLVGFIVLDGFTSTLQEKHFQENNSKYSLMLYINLTSGIISFLILVISGQLHAAFDFCNEHPQVYADASLLSGAAVVAQWFIYSQVQEFGALAFAATMNLRQVASVLGSYTVYSHPITMMQIIGLAIFFFALTFQSVVGFAYEIVERTPLLHKKSEAEIPEIKIRIKERARCCPSYGP